MFSLRALGALELVGEDGREVTGVLSGQKLVALLVYLAVARPRGMHRRDTLVALLWPELDQERARAALRHHLYRLRRALGAGAIVSRGDEDVGVDDAVVRCDAAAFDALLDAGRAEEALALYRGDLLPGFFVSGAPELEHWLAGERARLRERASSSAWRLATEHARAGRRTDAVRFARTAASLAPDDEQLLRRVLELLAECGDRAGALRAYEVFAQRLAVEYEAEPSAETAAVVARLRGQAPVRARPEPSRAARSGSPTAPTGAEPVTAGDDASGGAAGSAATMPAPAPAGGARAGWRRRRFVVLPALVAIGALAAGAVLGARELLTAGERGDATATIAVMPFEVRGSEDLRYLREGMIDLLSIGLDGAGGLESADPRAVMTASRREAARVEAGEALPVQRIAERVGARLYVTGSVVAAGGRIALTALLHERDGRVRARAQTRTAEAGQLFDLVDELVRQLLAGEASGPPTGLVRLAARTTSSVPAMRAFLEGERAIRAGQHAAALDAFQQAVAEDSTFALAWYRLGAAGRWTINYALADSAADRAAHLADALPTYAQRLLRAALAIRHGAYAEAESLYRSSVARRPNDVDAWFGLGDLHYHYNALRGQSKGEARAAFEQALRIDPEDGQSRLHLLELLSWEGRVDAVDSLLVGFAAGNDFAAKWPYVRALILRDEDAERRAGAALASADDRALVRVVVHSASAFPRNPDGALRLLALLTDPSRAPRWRAYGHYLRAQVELARGRWGAARAELTAMGAFEPAAATEFGALLSTLPFVPAGPDALSALRSALAGWDAAPTPPSTGYVFAAHDGVHPQLRLYLLGLASERAGDTAAAARWADSLAASSAGPAPSDSLRALVARNFAAALRARLARRRGAPARALSELGEPWLDPRTHAGHRSSLLSHVADRYLRAELLREAGRDADALRAYDAVADYSVDGLPYLAPAHLRRAAIHERMGNRERAAAHLRRFVELWRDCEPELCAVRDSARRELERLSARR